MNDEELDEEERNRRLDEELGREIEAERGKEHETGAGDKTRHERSNWWIGGGLVLLGVGIIFDTPLLVALQYHLNASPVFMKLPFPINSILAGIASGPIVGPICIINGLRIRRRE